MITALHVDCATGKERRVALRGPALAEHLASQAAARQSAAGIEAAERDRLAAREAVRQLAAAEPAGQLALLARALGLLEP